MLTAIIVTFILTTTLCLALRSGGRGGLIAHRPYGNRYNDAAGAREEAHLG